jgi:bacillolysin
MRKLLLFILISVVASGINGQDSGFKKISKKPAGSIARQFESGIVDGRNSMKSTPDNNARSLKSIALPSFQDNPVVIRRGNSPVYIEQKVTPLKSASAVTFDDRFFRFLEENKAVTNIENPGEVFKIKSIRTDELGITHIRSIQQYKGLEIYGSESVFHIDTEKERFTGSVSKAIRDMDINPRIQYSAALELMRNDLQKETVYRELTSKEKKFLKYEQPDCSLMIFDKSQGNYALAWMVMVRPNFIEEWQYIIDANNGNIIRKFNNTKTDGPTTGTSSDLNNISRTFDVYLEGGTYYLINLSEPMYNADTEEGMIMTLDANNTSTSDLDYSLITSANNTWSLKAAVSAHYNAFMAYEYFRTIFSRNSINGLGGNIISFVNVAEDDGSSMQNAFWNGQAVFYGNGGTHFKSLAGALDVSAHELGHGVVSNSANLEYYGQPGAMNEMYADIFGSMVDRDDWMIGEDVIKTEYFPSGALRSMSDPHNGGTENDMYWQPAHLSEMYLGTQDNGGVHINSGIGNKAYYLFATAVTKEKAESVFYRALTEYLTKTSQFIDLRIAVVQSAKDLYGATSSEASKAGDAFDAVGIYLDEPEEDEPDNYNPNPGQELLLLYNTDSNYDPTLYTSPVSENMFEPLTNTEMKGKVSVTDDGSAAVFVDLSDRINVMTLDPDDPWEDPLLDQEFFDNVAVSKDGNRLAAISVEVDASIFVYDFVTEQWEQFILYNPTTSDDNINSGGVLYADAIEFDHSGEYLIYDAYNELNSSTTDDISYWDVGFIKVWDNETQSFGDGSILKLFTQLPENVSVGNPVFSKNSPNIIAFDYFYYDGSTEEYAIYGANLENGELSLITENNTLGYPTYSKNDDKVAYTKAINASRDDVYFINVLNDRITPSGQPVFIIDYAKWPVYYAIGERHLGLAPVANFTADYKSGSAPLHVKFVDLSTNDPTQWAWTFQGGNPSTSTQQNPEVNYNSPGTYMVTLRASNTSGNNTLNREAYIVVGGITQADQHETPALLFYPNPAENDLHIAYDGNISVRIFSQSGALLISKDNQLQINISQLSQGVYILEIETDSGISRHKLLKR